MHRISLLDFCVRAPWTGWGLVSPQSSFPRTLLTRLCGGHWSWGFEGSVGVNMHSTLKEVVGSGAPHFF